MNELDWIKYRLPLLRSAWLPANEIIEAGEFDISKLVKNFGTEINKTSLNKRRIQVRSATRSSD